MSLIVRESLFVELPTVESKHEQFQSTLQSIRATWETTRFTCKSRQVMAQLRIITFNRVGIIFAFWNFVAAIVIPKTTISLKTITEIPFGLGCLINHELDGFLGTFPDNHPAQNTTRFAIYDGDDVDPVFLSPIKVNNSSISAFSTLSGTDATGNPSACAFAQLATLWWFTPRWRAIRRRFMPSTYICTAFWRISAL